MIQKLLNIKKIEHLSHAAETLIDGLRKQKIFMTPELIDILLESKNTIERMITEVASRQTIKTPINTLLNRVNTFEKINIDKGAVLKNIILQNTF